MHSPENQNHELEKLLPKAISTQCLEVLSPFPDPEIQERKGLNLIVVIDITKLALVKVTDRHSLVY